MACTCLAYSNFTGINMSEDPLVAGYLSAALIEGLQSNGIGTSPSILNDAFESLSNKNAEVLSRISLCTPLIILVVFPERSSLIKFSSF
jgi:hypothetical protein